MRKVTTLAALASLAVAWLPGGRALAQGSGEQPAFIQWQSPDDGAKVAGQAVHVRARVAFDGGVKSWSVEALAPDGSDYPGYGTICEKAEGGSPSYVNIDCVWDTTAYPNDGGPAQNRPYIVRVSAQGGAKSGMFSNGQAPAPRHEDRNVIVSNPVSAPRDVHLGWADNTRQATVGWQPNPEPDITSYVVQERFGDGPWKTVGQAGGKVTTFTRNLSAPGTYRYQVAALRAAGSGTDTTQSAWSGPAAEPKQIVVAEPKRPEATTTTTQPYAADAAGDTGPSGSPAPADPAAPAPASASGAANDPAAPGAPAPGPGTGDTSRNGALVSPIQPGSPGSVKSGGTTFGSPVAPQAAKPGQPAKAAEPLDESEGPDTGFSSALPYKQAKPADPNADKEDGEAAGRVLVGLPEAVGSDDARHLLIPLAGGLLLFVFAMHALYVSRRAAVEAPLDTHE
ncbi:MAG TPA: fibronectin type III domain-containing protein [Acidimicrobiia bacterium]|nr:fibronectin type III domain-containing protein [Acidimicrobiia bacterium]